MPVVEQVDVIGEELAQIDNQNIDWIVKAKLHIKRIDGLPCMAIGVPPVERPFGNATGEMLVVGEVPVVIVVGQRVSGRNEQITGEKDRQGRENNQTNDFNE